MRQFLKNAAGAVAVCVATLALALGVAEISLRVYQHRKYGIPLANDANHGLLRKDARLGWRMSENLGYRARYRDALNRAYTAHVTTDKHGFRIFGDPDAGKTRALIVGDSFTAGLDVSDDKTYYGLLKAALPGIEVFAYGAGGYGSLQEYLIVDEFLDLVRPDVVILQFYENDFLDNDPELDILKSFYNSGMPRPYLEPDGTIVRRYATYGGRFWSLPAPVAENLRLLKFLNARLGRLVDRRPGPDATDRFRIPREGLVRSAQTTRAILERLVHRAGKTPVCLFSVTDTQPYDDAIRSICRSVGIRFIDGVPQRLGEHERREPRATRAADGQHLNETGNRIVAERLAEFLTENGLVK